MGRDGRSAGLGKPCVPSQEPVISITDQPLRTCDPFETLGANMENQSRVNAIRKLAVVGEQAGFSLEQMIELLNSGMDVVALLDVITWRLEVPQGSSAQSVPQSC